MYYNGSDPEETVKLTKSWFDMTETGYESPITLMTRAIQSNVDDMVSDGILKAVCDVGISVDKDELIRALKYDREQYEKGYRDRDREIVRCKDCWKHVDIHCSCYELAKDENWFCADGERRKEEE